MNDEIMVSIVMPVYNHEKYIIQAVESVLMQEVNFKYELLIGEDCSTDSSRELLQRYKNNPSVVLLEREFNMHNNKIRNSIDLRLRSKGKYLTVLEGDDYWTDKHKLQKMVDYLESHDEVIACAHRFRVVNEEGEIYRDNDFECQFYQDNPYTKEVFEAGYMISHINSIVHRNIYRELPEKYLKIFTDCRFMGGDYIISAFLVLNGGIYCFSEYMSAYRKVVKKTSSSFSSSMEFDNKRDKVFEDVVKSEEYFNEFFQVSFNKRKRNVFASAVFKWYREKNKRNYEVVNNIIRISKSPIKYRLWFVYLISARFLLNCFNKKDIRVKF